MLRNLQAPEMYQAYSLWVKKAAPIVGDVFSLKSFEQNRRTRDDLPTAASPDRQWVEQ